MADSDEHGNDGQTRRNVLKTAGSLTGAGAMGALAGCSGDQPTETPDQGTEGSDDTPTETSGGSGEQLTLQFWSGTAAENTALTDHFNESMQNYESMQDGNVRVDIQPIPFSEIVSSLQSAVSNNNAPHVAQSGGAGIQFFENNAAIDHGSYIEETDGIPENWATFSTEAQQYRGSWFAGGTEGANNTMLTLRPQLWKDAGYDDPSEFTETWTDFTRAVQDLSEQRPNVFAYEESGAWNDLESYWGQAQTAFQGEDPWLRGDPDDPEILVGQGGPTDGMIRACVDRAQSFSSPNVASRTDEEMPALFLSNRAAANTTGFGNPQRWRAQDSEVEFGWDGDVWEGPIPRVDPNYGDEFGYDGLSGTEGQYGGSTSGLQSQYQVMSSDLEDAAWDLTYYAVNNEDHIVPIIGELYGNVATYLPINDVVQEQYELVQMQNAMIDTINNNPDNCRTTGAAWDVAPTDAIRFDSFNRAISETLAGQHSIDETVSIARSRTEEALSG